MPIYFLDTTDNQISGQLYSERSLGNATEMLIPQMLKPITNNGECQSFKPNS